MDEPLRFSVTGKRAVSGDREASPNYGAPPPRVSGLRAGQGIQHGMAFDQPLALSLAGSFLALAAPAHAEKRVALVVGNDNYGYVEVAEGGQRRPHHGRYAPAARVLRHGRGEPEPAGVFRTAIWCLTCATIRSNGRAPARSPAAAGLRR